MGKDKVVKKSSKDSYFKNIPGHYYDEKKRRLFKLAGNEFSKVQGVMTKEKLKAKEDEDKRLQDLKKDLKSVSHGRKSLLRLLNLRQIRSKNCQQISHEITSSIFSDLKCQGHLNASVFTKASDNSHLKKIKLGPSNESLATLAEGSTYHTINLVDLNHSKIGLALDKKICYDPENLKLDNLNFSASVRSSIFLQDRVVDFMWYAPKENIIFANTVGFNEPSHIYLCRDANIDVMTINKHIFSCAYSKKERVAIGHEFGVDLYDITGSTDDQMSLEPIQTLNSDKCQVHSATFSRDNGLLYYGDLKGCIRMYDFRQKQVHTVITLDKRARVDSFYECLDGNYLLSSFSNGQILMMDIRLKKFVLSYEEHKNDYLKIPLHVNPSEEYMTAVGTDCYTRVWDLRTSRLLRTIPPPVPVTRSRMPAVCFIPQLSQQFTNTVPGLFMSIEKEIFVYA